LHIRATRTDRLRAHLPARVRAGSYFGELALLNDETRRATVTTTSECELVALDRAAFERCARAMRLPRLPVSRGAALAPRLMYSRVETERANPPVCAPRVARVRLLGSARCRLMGPVVNVLKRNTTRYDKFVTK
jgi:hypothetical protein